jgi:hypothetical protein
MLVENKFLFLSLPRCISTAFYVTCLKQNIDVKRVNNHIDSFNKKLDINKPEDIIQLSHAHEKVSELKRAFGEEYPIITVKRDKYKRFYSFYKKFCKELIDNRYDIQMNDYFEYFTNMETEMFFDYKNIDINSNYDDLTTAFKIKHKLDFSKFSSKIQHSFNSLIFFMLKPMSFWTEYDPNLIWFDYDNLSSLEEWVSKEINKDFKLERVNSSEHKKLKPKMVVDDDFMRLYDKTYGNYDLNTKINRSLL